MRTAISGLRSVKHQQAGLVVASIDLGIFSLTLWDDFIVSFISSTSAGVGQAGPASSLPAVEPPASQALGPARPEAMDAGVTTIAGLLFARLGEPCP